MHPTNLIWTFLILVVLHFLFFGKYRLIEGLEGDNLDVSNAAEMCKTISTKAEEISAGFEGAQGLINAVLGPLSPANYKSGDNKSDNEVRNIITTSISPEVRTQITNECSNLATSMQSNVIDNTACEYCKTNECTISNITQENVFQAQQDCMLNSVATTLMKSQNDTNAQALAEAVQKAQGILSGDNKASTKNCNVVRTDISPKSYLDVINRCANSLEANQSNVLRGCGSMTNIIQKNMIEQLQECVVSNTTDQKVDTLNTTTTKTETKNNQTTEGIPAWASVASIFAVCIACVSLSLVFGFVANNATNKAAEVISENPELLQSMGRMGDD